MTRKLAGPRGFTLIELMLALSLVALVLMTALAGLRVGVSAWRGGEARAETQQHQRGLIQALDHVVAGAYPYLMAPPEGGQPAVLFEGEENRIAFVTGAPPVPPPAPAAFVAVTVAMAGGDGRGLEVRQRVMPNRDAFVPTGEPAFVDPEVTSVRFRYLGDDWSERWEPTRQRPMPRAVEITVSTRKEGERPAVTIPLRMAP
jgi:general secretion pathway protein J